MEEASGIPGFYGAFLHGSLLGQAADTLLPETSDVDVMLVTAGSPPQVRLGKFIYRGVLLEASHLASERLQSPEQVLTDYHLAGSFRAPDIIADPTGHLTRLGAAVSRDFARREWVRRRCEDAHNKAARDLRSVHSDRPHPDQVLAWLFGAGKAAHILLVAGLMNPTVRRRYAAVRELLCDYGHLPFYERLLEMNGCARISRAQAERHLAVLADVFDATSPLIRSLFPFASDLSAAARPIAIDGSRDLIEAGDHREAMFWIAVTYSRCMVVLHHDAPTQTRDRFAAAYQHLLDDLGVLSPDALQARVSVAAALLPQVWDVAEAVLTANPAVEA